MTTRIKLYRPHAGQQRILENARRFNVIVCARRFGKTELITSVKMPLISPAVFEGKKVGIFVDDFKDFAQSWARIVEVYKLKSEGGLIAKKDDTARIMEFVSGGVLEIWSIGDEGRKDKGRGRKYHRVIYEETQKIPDNVLEYHWQTVARPCLTDYRGDAFFIGTANGKNNYWYRLCQKGSRNGGCETNSFNETDLPAENESSEWVTFRMITTDNPRIDPAEVASASADLDRLTYEQEYMSVFVDYDGEAWVYVLKEKELQNRVFVPSRPFSLTSGEQFYISFDFNKIPMTAVVARKVPLPPNEIQRTRYKYGVHIIKEFKLGSIEKGEASIYDTCQGIREWVYAETGRKIGKWGDNRHACTVPFLITGDASGARSDGRQKVPMDYYQIIQDELQIAPAMIVVPKANPPHAESYVQTNTLISMNPEFKIYSDKCPSLIVDTLRIKSNNSRQIQKGRGEERQADLLDCLRYFINTFCKDIRVQ